MKNEMLALFGLTSGGVLLLSFALVIAWATLPGRFEWPKSINKNRLALFTAAASIASAPLWILSGPSFVAIAPFLSPAECTGLGILAFPVAFLNSLCGGGHLSPVARAVLPLVNGLMWGLIIERLVSVMAARKTPA